MQNVKALWSNLDPMRKAVAVLATLAVFAAVLGLARMASAPAMALLYAGLDGRQAGEVIAALDRQVAAYEIRGDAIFVDAAQRDALRMQLAGEGLPQNSGAGYELLDTLSGFGTTSQMFDAAYWRAKEGELARTLLSSPSVKQARVHIANPAPGPFQRGQETTASVTLTTRGGTLPEETAEAFRFLVASAIQGLSPADVVIIDATSGRVIGAGEGEADAGGSDRAAVLKANVQRLLEAQVGPGNAVVEVSVETVTDSESIRERRIDPESRVAISTDVEEVANSEQNGGGAGVTVASNLPDGAAASGNDTSQSQNSESRALTNFDLSETTREIERKPGAIKRLTVAVLINGSRAGSGDAAAGLDDLRELVASAVGYNAERGDQITVKAMPFEPRPELGTAASKGLMDSLAFDPLRLVQIGVLALTALALGLFVVRPVLRSSAAIEGIGGGARSFPLIDAEAVEATTVEPRRGEPGGEGSLPADPAAAGVPALADPGLAAIYAPTAVETPVESLKRLIEERQPDTIEILRTWLEDDSIEETA